MVFLWSVHQQGPEFNGYLVGRGNAREIDLNRDFPDLNALMYYYEKTKGRNHHLPLPDNWEHQVSSAEYNWIQLNTTETVWGCTCVLKCPCVYASMCGSEHMWVREKEGARRRMDEGIYHARVSEAE